MRVNERVNEWQESHDARPHDYFRHDCQIPPGWEVTRVEHLGAFIAFHAFHSPRMLRMEDYPLPFDMWDKCYFVEDSLIDDIAYSPGRIIRP